MTSHARTLATSRRPRFFYGWTIVAVGFLSHVACAFHMSSALSVFLKPLTEDLAVSRGLFSLLRSRNPHRRGVGALRRPARRPLRRALAHGGFFFYGIGLGGSWVLQEIIWATYYGLVSLGMVRGFGILITHAFGAAGAPFFGLIHDATGSYRSSFVAFTIALVASAFLSLAVRAPRQPAPQR